MRDSTARPKTSRGTKPVSCCARSPLFGPIFICAYTPAQTRVGIGLLGDTVLQFDRVPDPSTVYKKVFLDSVARTLKNTDEQREYTKLCKDISEQHLKSDIITAETPDLDFLDKDNNTNKVCGKSAVAATDQIERASSLIMPVLPSLIQSKLTALLLCGALFHRPVQGCGRVNMIQYAFAEALENDVVFAKNSDSKNKQQDEDKLTAAARELYRKLR